MSFFFFQAEDGIRDIGVTGVQTCALPIFWSLVTNLLLKGDPYPLPYVPLINPLDLAQAFVLLVLLRFWLHLRAARYSMSANRSEERRVGKECRSRWRGDH